MSKTDKIVQIKSLVWNLHEEDIEWKQKNYKRIEANSEESEIQPGRMGNMCFRISEYVQTGWSYNFLGVRHAKFKEVGIIIYWVESWVRIINWKFFENGLDKESIRIILESVFLLYFEAKKHPINSLHFQRIFGAEDKTAIEVFGGFDSFLPREEIVDFEEAGFGKNELDHNIWNELKRDLLDTDEVRLFANEPVQITKIVAIYH